MARRSSKSSASSVPSVSAHSPPSAGSVEWIGGALTPPAAVAAEGGSSIHPEVFLWMIPQGPVLAMALGTPDKSGTTMLEAFENATHRPMAGPPHRPARVRVASAEWAALLRTRLRGAIEVVCAPTPELEPVAKSMLRFFQEHPLKAEAEATYLGGGITTAQMGSFFRSAARLFRARPWDAVPDDNSVLSVTCEALGLHQAALSVIGQLGESLGFVCFDSNEDFERYLDQVDQAQEELEAGRPARLPVHWALNFEPASDLEPSLRAEVNHNRWEVVSPEAYPWVLVMSEDLVARPATSEELTRAEAIALALTELVTTEPHLKRAWTSKQGLTQTFSVETHEGTFSVNFQAPHTGANPYAGRGAVGELLTEVRDEDGTIDPDWFSEYSETLLSGFEESPEAEPFETLEWSAMAMEFGVHFLNATVAAWTPRLLEELLFSVVPRRLSAGAEEASGIIAELKAFFLYLRRAHGLQNMDACLRVLEGNTEQRLAHEMADPRNFGMAKSFFMQGKAEGFDLSTKEGVDAWVQTSNARQAGLFGAPAAARSASKNKDKSKAKAKAKAKAAKASKKKNR